jgi:hypothetical protein
MMVVVLNRLPVFQGIWELGLCMSEPQQLALI